MKLIIDLDETVFQFLKAFCHRYNSQVKDPAKWFDVCDFTSYNSQLINDNQHLFQTEKFFENLEPYPGAIEILSRLNQDGFIIHIVTDALAHPAVASGKLKSIRKHMPFILSKYITITGNKGDIKGDLIFDDAPQYLEDFDGITVCNDKLFNQNFKADFRIYNNDFSAFYTLVHRLRDGRLTALKTFKKI